jgi:hypothetical protein
MGGGAFLFPVRTERSRRANGSGLALGVIGAHATRQRAGQILDGPERSDECDRPARPISALPFCTAQV